MKCSKGDALTHDQVKGNPTSNETEPLFPRLHVNKTEKTGPRAPPRNKMALYEQFTIPSNRFVQPNKKSSSLPYQQQIHYGSSEYQYPYLPCYMPSPMIYSNSQLGIPVYGQLPHGASSGGMSCTSAVVTDDEAEKVCRQLSSGVSRVMLSRDGGSSTTRKIFGKKTKDDSDSSVHIVPCATGHEKRIAWHTNFNETSSSPHVLHIGGGWQQAHIVNVRSECPPERELPGNPCIENHDENGHAVMVEKDRSQCVYLLSDDHNGRSDSVTSISQFCQQSTSVDAQHVDFQVNESEISEDIRNSTEGETLNISDKTSLAEQGVFTVDSKDTLSKDETTESNQYQGLKISNIHKNDENGSSNDGRSAALSTVMNRGEVTGESKGDRNVDTEASEPSMYATGKSGNSDDTAVSVIASKLSSRIKPKDVIRLVGQQQFWKARKALLRQQRIFSDQVFQLHKLIKVQQLLAEMPGTLINEETQFVSIDESDDSPHSNLMDAGNCVKQRRICLDDRECQKLEIDAQTEKVSSNLGWHQATSKDVELNVSAPSSHHGAVSAWGYPSIGMGQWMSPMAMQGQPLIHQQFTVPPFGPQYGSAMLGQMSHMLPFGIPCYDQRLMDIQQNRGPITLLNNHMGPNPSNIQNDISGSWNFMPYNPFHYQGLYSVASKKDGPTGSGASVNQSPTKLPGIRTSSVPSIQRQLRMNLNMAEDDLSVCDHSKVNCSASTCTQSNSCSRKSNCDQNDDVNKAYLVQNSSSRDNGGVSKNGEAKVMSWHKGVQASMAETCTTHSGNSLNLLQIASSSLEVRDKVKFGKFDGQVIKAVPHPAIDTSKSAAGILRSLQRERQQ